MADCKSCNKPVSDDSAFCGSCGTPVRDLREDLTRTTAPEDSAPAHAGSRVTHHGAAGILHTTTSEHSRFLPGVMVAERYRIIGLLGKGGMGEVYRADDVKLGQPVALKFLPESLENDAGRLDRFLGEVRVARQVSHANVCRVYDIGEVGGQHYLSMEFVDGEDLGSLLRRIGRLPQDKAAELSRQICAGVAAAHAKGVIHRDLKPANIMIDGEGKVRITDFGLAGIADQFKGAEIRVGTPAYMSPEQLAGREVTVRSDIYSLGLVLYELSTGKAAFTAPTLAELSKMQQESSPASPTTLVPDMDPAMERVILRCIEKDPEMRPASALMVAAALPGGDPLAAALEAGETPSPEMVAAAGPEGGLKPRTALICLAIAILGVFLLTAMRKQISLVDQVPMDRPILTLEDKAGELIRSLGYEEEPVDTYNTFAQDNEAVAYIAKENESPDRWSVLNEPGQAAVYYFHRQGSRKLVKLSAIGGITASRPSPRPGDITLWTDLTGRLRYFIAHPAGFEFEPEPGAPTEEAWEALFSAAGLDIGEFESTEPTLQPSVFSDSRMAWSGVIPFRNDMPVRVEAAALRGKAVFFNLLTPGDERWAPVDDDAPVPSTALVTTTSTIILILLLSAVGFAVFLALRNRRMGRGDSRGALRLAVALAILYMLYWAFTNHHVASVGGEIVMIYIALGASLALGLLVWVLYMAMEPYARKFWPEAMVGWTRMLAGRFRDPLVARDLLFGFTVSIGFLFLQHLNYIVPAFLKLSTPAPLPFGLGPTVGTRFAMGSLVLLPLISLAGPLFHFTLLLVARLILRKQWLANIAFVLFVVVSGITQILALAGGEAEPVLIIVGALLSLGSGVLIVVLMTRFGLLAAAGNIFFANLLGTFPLTFDPSRPYFTTSLIGIGLALVFAFLAFRGSLAGRSLNAGSFLDA
ncbi:MAG: protein kinase [Acidobacteria bacterium]|uniref:Protein kinase n=1 Tax=Candidatus Polarisedimenticola svalbardensis TaxID=2886004 RepID=A0A8J6Y6S2_9BACT|nr:protein kinase [Candidatus Polarisedimenticola svalbardensis]